MENTEKTLVIFRRWRKNPKSVIAIFPYELGDSSPYTCMSFEHVGQHGACDPAIVHDTRSCNESEEDVKELIAELQSRGYILKIGKKIPRNALYVREKALKEFYA